MEARILSDHTITGDSQSITCRVENVTAQLMYHLTVVYSFNIKEERRGLWIQLKNLSTRVNLSCLIVGDYNSVLHDEDRIEVMQLL